MNHIMNLSCSPHHAESAFCTLLGLLQLQMLLGSWSWSSWTPPRTSPTQPSLSSINKRSFCNYDGGYSVQVDLAQRFHHKLKCSINQGGAGENFPDDQLNLQRKGFWNWDKWKANSDEMKSKLAKLGLAAVLAYGLFDAVTYTSFFVLAFLGYEKSTGKNPAANLQALFGIVILMWTGNNITRPFRVAGAAALAPFIDKGLKKIQNHFKFPNLGYAFALVVSVVAASCLIVVGLLILSRW